MDMSNRRDPRYVPTAAHPPHCPRSWQTDFLLRNLLCCLFLKSWGIYYLFNNLKFKIKKRGISCLRPDPPKSGEIARLQAEGASIGGSRWEILRWLDPWPLPQQMQDLGTLSPLPSVTGSWSWLERQLFGQSIFQ